MKKVNEIMDIVVYMFNPLIIKYGVIKSIESNDRVELYCTMKDSDGFWQFKQGYPTYVANNTDIIMNITNNCTILGKNYLEKKQFKKVKYIIQDQIIKELNHVKKLIAEGTYERPLPLPFGEIPNMKENSKMDIETNGADLFKRSNSKASRVGSGMIEELKPSTLHKDALNPKLEKNKKEMEQDEFEVVDFNLLIEEEESIRNKLLGLFNTESTDNIQNNEKPDLIVEEKAPKQQLRKRRETVTEKKKRKAEEELQKNLLKEQAEKRKRAEESVRFARNTTTNIRFDISKLGLGFIKQNDHGGSNSDLLERKMSNSNLNLALKPSETLTLGDMLLECINEIRSGTENKSLSIAGIGTVPSKSDLDILNKYIQTCMQFISNTGLLTIGERKISIICMDMWSLLLKYINGLDSSQLFNIKNDITAKRTSNIKVKEDPKIDRISFDLRVVVFMFNSLSSKMDQFYTKQFNEMKTNLLECILEMEECTNRYYRIWFQYYQQLIDILNINDDCKDMIESLNLKLVKRVALSKDKNRIIDEPQLDPFIVRLIKFMDRNQMKITSKFWGLFVNVIMRDLEERVPDNYSWLASSYDNILKMMNSSLKIKGASILKGFNLAAIRLSITKPLVTHIVENTHNNTKKLDSFLKKLSEDDKYLPFFISIFQSIQKTLDIDTIKALGLKTLNNFIITYVYKNDAERLEEFKIRVYQSKHLEQVRTNIIDKLTGDAAEDIIDDIISILNNESTVQFPIIEKDLQNWTDQRNKTWYETYPEYPHQYYFWVNLINEVYLMNVLEKEYERVTNLRAVVQKNQKKLKESLSKEDYKFLIEITTNFEQVPILSLQPGMNESDIKIRIIIVHLMVQYMQLSHENDFLTLSSVGVKSLYQRDQLCAYPCEEEEKYRVIAMLVYEKELSQWNSAGYDVTSLNQCQCGYYYFIGNCGKPNQESACPECKKQIGGMNHNYASQQSQAVSNKDFLKMYGKLEKQGGKKYQRRDIDHIDSSISLRYIKGSMNFRLIEMFIHIRYLLEYVVGSNQEIEGINKFIGISNDEVGDYLVQLIKKDFESAITNFKSETKAYHWITCLSRSIRIHPEKMEFKKAKRNLYERELSQKIDHFVLNGERIIKDVYKSKGEDDGKLKSVVSGWVEGSVIVDDLLWFFPQMDLRVVTALKNTVIESSTSEDYIRQMNILLETKYQDPSSLVLLKYVMIHEDILLCYDKLISAPLDLTNYLMKRLDSKITWREACALSISDLCTPEDERDLIVDERYEDLIERFGNDRQLKVLFDEFITQWKHMMTLRDKYSAVFDFRFMCHTDTISEQSIIDMIDIKKAKLSYFLITEANVESLMINSILQTLSKYQNSIISSFPHQFQQVNGIKPLKQSLQQSSISSDIIRLNNKLEDLIVRCVKHVGSSGHVDINLDLLERMLAEELLVGKPTLEFQGSEIEYFSLHFDFNMTCAKVQEISMRVGQEHLDIQQSSYLDTLVHLNAAHIFSQFQRAVKKTTIHNTKELQPTDLLKFDDDKEGFNQMSIKMSQVKDFYLKVETALFKKSVKYLDVMFLADLPLNIKQTVKAHERFASHGSTLNVSIKRIIMRQLVGSNNEKLAQTDLKTALEYSDTFEQIGREIPEPFIEACLELIPLHTTLAQALSLSTVLPLATQTTSN